MATVKNYLSLIKFSHTIFAMPFAMIGFVLGIFGTDMRFKLHNIFYPSQNNYEWFSFSTEKLLKSPENDFVQLFPSLTFKQLYFLLVLVILCMVFARSAAMAFNRWLDAKYDARNPRTAVREIPLGIIKPQYALAFTIVCCLLFIVCCYFINKKCFYLSPVALFVILFYSYTKRFTAFCHLVLGVGLSLAPIGAYIAVANQFALLPVLFSIIVFCWVSGFDIIYALQDEQFDKENKLHSIPAAIGKVKALRASELLHLLSAACVVYAGIYGGFGIWYWIGVAIFIGLLIYQHLLVKPADLSKVNMAFFTTNGIASVVFAIFVITDLFLHFL